MLNKNKQFINHRIGGSANIRDRAESSLGVRNPSRFHMDEEGLDAERYQNLMYILYKSYFEKRHSKNIVNRIMEANMISNYSGTLNNHNNDQNDRF